jgi:hypothetical protein
MLRKQRLKVYALYICTLVTERTLFKTSAYTLFNWDRSLPIYHVRGQHMCVYTAQASFFSAWRWFVFRNVLQPASCCSRYLKCVTAHSFTPHTNFVNESDMFILLATFLWTVPDTASYLFIEELFTSWRTGRCQSLLQNLRYKNQFLWYPSMWRSSLLVYANRPKTLISVSVFKVRVHFFALDILNRKRVSHAQSASVWIVVIAAYFFYLYHRSWLSGRIYTCFSYDFAVPFFVFKEKAAYDPCLF